MDAQPLPLDETRARLSEIPDEDRCSDDCPGYIVSESSEHGVQIERCDECTSHVDVFDEDVQALPEARELLARTLLARSIAERKPDGKCCCTKCGGLNVEYAVWHNPNTGETGDVFGTWNAGDNMYCSDCDENTPLCDASAEPEEFAELRQRHEKTGHPTAEQ